MNGLELQNVKLIRSEESCRNDLEKWGVKFNPISKSTYFEGNERIDIICYRNQFIEHFVSRASNYYLLTESDPPEWIPPSSNPCILICHNETIFQSGEQSAKRWQMDGIERFFNKGKKKYGY